MFCKTRKHYWLDPADAHKCCNGYRSELRLGDVSGCNAIGSEPLPGGVIYGYAWVPEPEIDIMTECSPPAPKPTHS
jgi:hypothetical protein